MINSNFAVVYPVVLKQNRVATIYDCISLHVLRGDHPSASMCTLSVASLRCESLFEPQLHSDIVYPSEKKAARHTRDGNAATVARRVCRRVSRLTAQIWRILPCHCSLSMCVCTILAVSRGADLTALSTVSKCVYVCIWITTLCDQLHACRGLICRATAT